MLTVFKRLLLIPTIILAVIVSVVFIITVLAGLLTVVLFCVAME